MWRHLLCLDTMLWWQIWLAVAALPHWAQTIKLFHRSWCHGWMMSCQVPVRKGLSNVFAITHRTIGLIHWFGGRTPVAVLLSLADPVNWSGSSGKHARCNAQACAWTSTRAQTSTHGSVGSDRSVKSVTNDSASYLPILLRPNPVAHYS